MHLPLRGPRSNVKLSCFGCQAHDEINAKLIAIQEYDDALKGLRVRHEYTMKGNIEVGSTLTSPQNLCSGVLNRKSHLSVWPAGIHDKREGHVELWQGLVLPACRAQLPEWFGLLQEWQGLNYISPRAAGFGPCECLPL